MKLRLLIVAVLVTAAAFGQGPGSRRENANPGTPPTFTPPTAAQLAAAQLMQVARYLRLDSAQTSALTAAASPAVAAVEKEQNDVQACTVAINLAYKTLAADIATNKTTDASMEESTIETQGDACLHAKVMAAGSVLAALPGLGIAVTTAQATGVAQLMIGGGGPGFGGPGLPRGRFARPAPASSSN